MCYGKAKLSRKVFRKRMHQLTEDFIKDMTPMENQEKVNNLVMDAVEGEYRSQNQAFLRTKAIANTNARDPISKFCKLWNLWKDNLKNFSHFLKNEKPRFETTILEMALDVWEGIKKKVKEFSKYCLIG